MRGSDSPRSRSKQAKTRHADEAILRAQACRQNIRRGARRRAVASATVSYTHLDVYKRQEYDGAAVRLYNRIFKLRNIVGLVGCKSLRALLHALGEKRLHALRIRVGLHGKHRKDVYKRQPRKLIVTS